MRRGGYVLVHRQRWPASSMTMCVGVGMRPQARVRIHNRGHESWDGRPQQTPYISLSRRSGWPDCVGDRQRSSSRPWYEDIPRRVKRTVGEKSEALNQLETRGLGGRDYGMLSGSLHGWGGLRRARRRVMVVFTWTCKQKECLRRLDVSIVGESG